MKQKAEKIEELRAAFLRIAERNRSDLFLTLRESNGQNLSNAWFSAFEANFRLRTLFTIPEVFLNGVVAGNYGSHSGIVLAGSIVADESGNSGSDAPGNVGAVHSALLEKAFSYHRQAIYQLPALSMEGPLCLLRNVIRIEEAVRLQTLSEQMQRESLGGQTLAELVELIRTECEPHIESTREGGMTDLLTQLLVKMREWGIFESTRLYCLSQLRTQRSLFPTRILARSAMHEFLADSLLHDVERSIFLPFVGSQGHSEEAYVSNIAPYFLAHRDEANDCFIENQHAERLLELLSSFLRSESDQVLAYEEARCFAFQQKKIWDDLLQAYLSGIIRKDHPASPRCGHNPF